MSDKRAPRRSLDDWMELVTVFCKHFLDKVAKLFWTLLHVQIGQSCKALASLELASQTSLADILCESVKLFL